MWRRPGEQQIQRSNGGTGGFPRAKGCADMCAEEGECMSAGSKWKNSGRASWTASNVSDTEAVFSSMDLGRGGRDKFPHCSFSGVFYVEI